MEYSVGISRIGDLAHTPVQAATHSGHSLKTIISHNSPATYSPLHTPCITSVPPREAEMCQRTRFRYQNCSHEFVRLDKVCDKAEAGESNCASVMFVEQLEGSCRACREQQKREAWFAEYRAGMEERRQVDEARDKANKDRAENN